MVSDAITDSELRGYKERLQQLLKASRQQPIGSIEAAHNAKQVATVRTLIQAYEFKRNEHSASD
jgi:hypothetical protein